MPRRPAKIVRDIPLCLIPGMVKRGVSIHGARLKRMIVWESRSHFYNISIRTKPVRKERKGSSARCGTGADLPEPNLADRESSGRDPEDTGPDDGSGGELE
jgi:hypothetical protein